MKRKSLFCLLCLISSFSLAKDCGVDLTVREAESAVFEFKKVHRLKYFDGKPVKRRFGQFKDSCQYYYTEYLDDDRLHNYVTYNLNQEGGVFEVLPVDLVDRKQLSCPTALSDADVIKLARKVSDQEGRNVEVAMDKVVRRSGCKYLYFEVEKGNSRSRFLSVYDFDNLGNIIRYSQHNK